MTCHLLTSSVCYLWEFSGFGQREGTFSVMEKNNVWALRAAQPQWSSSLCPWMSLNSGSMSVYLHRIVLGRQNETIYEICKP